MIFHGLNIILRVGGKSIIDSGSEDDIDAIYSTSTNTQIYEVKVDPLKNQPLRAAPLERQITPSKDVRDKGFFGILGIFS